MKKDLKYYKCVWYTSSWENGYEHCILPAHSKAQCRRIIGDAYNYPHGLKVTLINEVKT